MYKRCSDIVALNEKLQIMQSLLCTDVYSLQRKELKELVNLSKTVWVNLTTCLCTQ